jgi:urease accessory protein
MADPLYRLLAWLSPAYPIGAFSHSHGVETAVEHGFIKDRASLVRWLQSVLRHGTGAVDFGACLPPPGGRQPRLARLDAIAERAAAWRGTAEMALESRQRGLVPVDDAQGLAASALDAAHARLAARAACRSPGAGAAHGIALQLAIEGYLHAFTANLISAAPCAPCRSAKVTGR